MLYYLLSYFIYNSTIEIERRSVYINKGYGTLSLPKKNQANSDYNLKIFRYYLYFKSVQQLFININKNY